MLVLRINFQKSEIFLQILPLLLQKAKRNKKREIFDKKKLKDIIIILYTTNHHKNI